MSEWDMGLLSTQAASDPHAVPIPWQRGGPSCHTAAYSLNTPMPSFNFSSIASCSAKYGLPPEEAAVLRSALSPAVVEADQQGGGSGLADVGWEETTEVGQGWRCWGVAGGGGGCRGSWGYICRGCKEGCEQRGVAGAGWGCKTHREA